MKVYVTLIGPKGNKNECRKVVSVIYLDVHQIDGVFSKNLQGKLPFLSENGMYY